MLLFEIFFFLNGTEFGIVEHFIFREQHIVIYVKNRDSMCQN